MKKTFLWAGCLVASLSLFACGDDSSSSPDDNVDREDSKLTESSSSVEEEESSSSVEEESSSSEEVIKIRAAKLEDFEKNMVLKGLFGKDIYLSTGSKNGMFSLWLPGEVQDSAWVVVRSDFENGEIQFNSDNATVAYIDGKGTIDSLKALVEDKKSITFIVNEEGEEPVLQYFVGKGDTNEVKTSKMKVPDNVLSSAESIVGKTLSCAMDDTTRYYSFYDDSFLMLSVADGDTIDWVAGYFDIQHNKLLMNTKFFKKSASVLYTVEVSPAFELAFTSGLKLSCKSSDFKFENIDFDEIAGEWDATDDGLNWSMDLKEDASFEIKAAEGREDIRRGNWNVLGDILFLKSTTCVDRTCQGIMGKVTKFDAKKGFTYTHTASYPNDGEEHSPELPTEWQLPRYE